MIVSGGALALTGVILLINLNLQFNAAAFNIDTPRAPVVHQLRDGLVEVDWDDVRGADRYQLQQWHPSGWIDLPSEALDIAVNYYGSRAVVNKRSPGALINTFRVKAFACGVESDWSDYGRKADHGYISQRNDSYVSTSPSIALPQSYVIWSGVLTAGAADYHRGERGYSMNDTIGLLSADVFNNSQGPLSIIRALQTDDGFLLELRHRGNLPTNFTLSLQNAGTAELTQLSSCNSVRLPSEHGGRYFWPDAGVEWVEGSHTVLSISLTEPSAVSEPQRLLRPMPPLTASFPAAPSRHAAEQFSLMLRFSQPVAVDAETLRRALTIRGGVAASVAPVGEQRDLWTLRIAPDSRRSVRVQLNGGSTCGSKGAICTPHQLRLVNRPQVVVMGPPITARVVSAPGVHSGSREFPVRIQLSEPLAASARSLERQALRVSGGLLTDVRRVDGRRDLWELLIEPQSAETVEVALDPPGVCSGEGGACLDDLRRLASPLGLSIPPAIVHLTFDDGPHPVYTPQILDILAWHGARATFFVTGESVALYPELVKRIVSEGHTLANHTWDHVALDTLTSEEFDDTVLRTQEALGEYATPCLRPPYYRADDETYVRAARLGINIVMGNVRPRDWTRPGARVIANRIVGGAAPNAVVVLHDGGGDRSQTVEGLRMALAHLQAQNYSFEPVCN